MKEIVVREREITAMMKRLCERDSRLGFHSEAESYLYTPAYFDWRMPTLMATAARLGEIESDIRAGRGYPLSPLEKAAPTFSAKLDVKGGLVIEGEAKGSGDVTVWTYDVCGTEWRTKHVAKPRDGHFKLTIPDLEWNGDPRLRPAWIQIHQGCHYLGDSWQWPTHPAFEYRWHNGDLLGYYSARIVIGE